MDFYEYFQADPAGIWQWEDEGEVLSLVGGSTIAYRAYVVSLLETLAEGGIPPFGALLLTLVATNPDGRATLDTALARYRQSPDTLGDIVWERWEKTVTDAFAFLYELAAVPPAYKTGSKRVLLLQAIFAGSHNRIGRVNAVTLVRQLAGRRYEQAKLRGHRTPSQVKARQAGELEVLALLGRRFPTMDLILSRIADLPNIPEPLLPDDPAPPATEPTDFVQALLAEPKTFEVGALVRRLWSGLAVPFRQALPDQQPTGGVSDLTNTGDLSRLLVSELAYDDLTFLSRLANNEALYLNRELPPATDPRERMVLLDVSLKTWGTPHVLAMAIAVALDRHPRATARCRVFALGNVCIPLDISTLDGIIDGLTVLAGCLHPADGLADFFRQHAPPGPVEIFLVSTPATLRLPAMQRALSDHQARLAYLLLTDSAGHVSLYRQQRGGRKHLQDLALPLTDLWANKPSPTKPSLANDPAPAPRPHPTLTYPILFPADTRKGRPMQDENASIFIFYITGERCLFRYQAVLYSDAQLTTHTPKGWQLIYDKLPFTADECEIGYIPPPPNYNGDRGDYVLLLFHKASRELWLLNLTTLAEQRAYMPDWKTSPYPHFFFVNAPPPLHKNLFQYMTATQYWTVDPTQELTIVREDEKPANWLIDFYEHRETRQKKLAGWYMPRLTILKNVNTVFINNLGNLVLNRHELRLLPDGIVRLEPARNSQKQHEAMAFSKQEFRFADGSSVIVNRAGMLVLVSSDPTLPVVYVPLVLDSPIALATDTDFAGLDYYQPTDSTQRTVPVPDFWQRFIVPFVDRIDT
jgi:MoxR-vWA-beta-propeller ternary system domain bpX0/MoxR-vWA-beta-propeller ternary system domain bpX1